MTVRFVKSWNGYYEGQIVSGLGTTEENRLIGLGFAVADLDGPGNSPVAVYAQTNEITGRITNSIGGVDYYPTYQSAVQTIRDLPLRKIAWWGDSTIEAASGNGVIPAAWAATDFFSSLPGQTLHKNFGANGYSTSAILSAPTNAVNSYGNTVTPEGVGAECVNAHLLGITFGINDLRLDPNVATYGSAPMIAAVQALQSRLVTMVNRLRVAAQKIPIMWIVPNAMCMTGAFITGSVTGQALTDALRATYLGDEFLGISSLSTLVANSKVCDSGAAVFGVVSPALAEKPMHMADELHPSTQGYQNRAGYISEWLNSICLADEYQTIAGGSLVNSEATYTDVSFVERLATLFGNTSGTSYGTLSAPALGVGDELVVTTASGARKILRIKNIPYQNAAENYLRWLAPGIDGAFHSTDLPAGSTVLLRRKKVASVYDAVAARGGYRSYPVRVIAGGNGTVTVRSIPGGLSLVDRAPTTGDFIAVAASGGNHSAAQMGLALTGATIGAASGIGAYTITLAGTYFTSAVGQIGSIIVPA